MLFLDEIHRMSRPAEEMLYMAMEDFRVDVIVGKGPGATAIPLDIPPFTLVGATTRAGLLPGPLRDRFGFTAHMDFYAPGRAGARAGPQRRGCSTCRCTPTAPRRSPVAPAAPRGSPTGCCAGCATTPRSAPTASVDPDRRPGRAGGLRGRRARPGPAGPRGAATPWCGRFGGGPVGLATLAVAVGEERETVEEVAEPFLVREGLLARTPRGRVATRAAWEHLGRRPPKEAGWDAALGSDPDGTLFDDSDG